MYTGTGAYVYKIYYIFLVNERLFYKESRKVLFTFQSKFQDVRV